MLAASAEFERDRIGERIRDAKRHQKRAGKFLGGHVPFGWHQDDEHGVLVEDRAQQAALGTMRRLREEGKSFRAIAKAIHAQHNIEVSKDTTHRALRTSMPDRLRAAGRAQKNRRRRLHRRGNR